MTEKDTLVPYSWIKAIDPKVAELDQIPLFGSAPSFPLDEYIKLLRSTLEINDLDIKPTSSTWRAENELSNDLGADIVFKEIAITGISGSLFFILPSSSLALLVGWLIATPPPSSLELFDKELIHALETFLVTTLLLKVKEVNFDSTLSLQVKNKSTLPQEPCFSIDLLISSGTQTITARILFTPSFLSGWKERYTHRKMEIPLSSELLKKIYLTLHAEISKTSLTKKEYEELSPGDILLLNQASIDPKDFQGSVDLTFEGIPKFRGKLSNGKVQITELVSLFTEFHGINKKS